MDISELNTHFAVDITLAFDVALATQNRGVEIIARPLDRRLSFMKNGEEVAHIDLTVSYPAAAGWPAFLQPTLKVWVKGGYFQETVLRPVSDEVSSLASAYEALSAWEEFYKN
jgi:hypothetical protein